MARAPHIVLGVTGSIAAYKAAELVRRMKSRKWNVTVVMTRAATEFVGELTFRTLTRQPVGLDMFAQREAWKPEHIAYAERADILVIAPCTANVMAKLAHGLSDDLLSCTALACPAPLVIAPAMNTQMWTHPATKDNCETLKRRGAIFVMPGEGELACGVQGQGRMAEVDEIMAVLEKKLGTMTLSDKGEVR